MSRTRRHVALAGVAVVLAYVGSAMVSGHLSPLARRPLLDGLAPPAPYRWVDPPAALAADNQPPTPGTFPVDLTANGSKTAVFTTDDAQVTLILAKGAFAPAGSDTSVEIVVTPIAPDEVGAPDPPLRIIGNVVRLEATYQPSGTPVADVGDGARIVLVYPFTLNEHGSHTIVSSPHGRHWDAPETNDLPSIQQADALVEMLGLVAVARNPAVTPGASPTAGAETGSGVATIAIVAGLIVLTLAVVVMMRRGSERSRRDRRPRQGSRPVRRR